MARDVARDEQTMSATTQVPRVHIVKKGETLSGIAQLYKMPIPKLKKANPQLERPPKSGRYDTLYPGDKVNVPQ